jgi:hypothetical protein
MAGTQGVLVSACAASLCLAGTLAALIAGDLLAAEKWVLVNMGVGMALRLGLPLGACVAVYVAGGRLADGGFAYNLLIYYPVLLAAETVLTVGRMRHAAR